MLRCAKHTLLVFAVTMALILGYPDPSYYPFDTASDGVTSGFRILFEAIVCYQVGMKARIEFGEMVRGGLAHYYGGVGFAFLEQLLASTYCSTILIVVIIRIIGVVRRAHFINVEGPESPSVFGTFYTQGACSLPNGQFPSVVQHADVFFQTIAVSLLYTYALSLLVGFQLTGMFMIIIVKMLKRDVARFMLVYVVLLMAFATALLALESINGPPPQVDGWTAIWFNIYNLFLFVVGNGSVTGWSTASNGWGGFFNIVFVVLVCVYVILIVIMELNLLIAMMSNTYNDAKQAANYEHVQYQAQIIMSLEEEMSPSDWKGVVSYWIVDSGQPWFQLQIKNEEFLQQNVKEGQVVQALEGQKAADKAAESSETKEEKFSKVDTDGDGKVSKSELAAFEQQIRQKVEMEVLARLAMGSGGPAMPKATPSLFVQPSELSGGFRRTDVYNVDNSS